MNLSPDHSRKLEPLRRGQGLGSRLVLCLVVLLGPTACMDGCKPERSMHVEPLRASLPADGPGILAEEISVSTGPSGEVAAAVRDAGGGVHYVAATDEGWLVERVTDGGAVPGSLSLTHTTAGEALIAAVLEDDGGFAPPIAALAESPVEEVAGEGNLVVFRRRTPGLWRERPVASRALLPSVAAGEGHSIFLAFLQPTSESRFVVVSARLDGRSIAREEVRRGARRSRPHLVLMDGAPVVTYAVGGDEAAVVRARAERGGVFRESDRYPQSMFGEGLGPVEAFAVIDGDGGASCLAALMPVEERRLRLEGAGVTILDERARIALVRACTDEEGVMEARILGTLGGDAAGALVALRAGKEASSLVSSAGGQPLVFEEQADGSSASGDAESSASAPEDERAFPVWIVSS